MKNHVYKSIEITGTSDRSIEDAIQTALKRANQSLEHLRWFEVTDTRGSINAGQVDHYQVTLKIGFTLADKDAAAQPA
jgi:flavin-binding protein dodecin